jgi:arylsulfatase A-like enzyme
MKIKYLSLLMLFCITTFPLLAQTSNPKKNVVIFLIDDLRPMLSSYGDSWIQTPHIDALAKKSIQFNRAYCNVPVCGASRASILTGIRPARNRFLSYDSRIDKDVSGAVITLPQLLKQQGYKTISNGKVSHHSSDRELDWNEIWNPKEATSFRDYANPKNKFADKNSLPVPPFESSVVNDALLNIAPISVTLLTS